MGICRPRLTSVGRGSFFVCPKYCATFESNHGRKEHIMRRAIAGLIAGLVLGTATTAGAAGVYWNRGGTAYKCEGISAGVTCKSGRFEVGITPSFVYVQERGSKLTYGCKKWETFADCFSD